MSKTCTFTLKLYDDESVRKKLTVMTPLEVMCDDARNDIPDEYYEIVDVPLGGQVEITVRRIDP